MGGSDFFDIFDKMMDWYDKNPEEAKQQNGFEVRAGFLDELDTAFYALNDKMYDLSTAWIRGWPELKIVPDSGYEAEIMQLAHANPKREERLVAQRIVSLDANFTEPLRLALGLAAASCNPPERLLSIHNGSHQNLPDGRNEMLWNVQTTHGQRYGYTGEKFCALYDCIVHDNSHMPDITDTEGMMSAINDGRLNAYKPSEVGEALSGIATAEIMMVQARAKRVHAGAAIDLLLLRINLDPNEASVGVHSVTTEEGDPLLLEMTVHVKELNLKVGIFDNGAVLLPWQGAEPLASASIEEIEHHQKKTKAMDFS